MSMRFSARGRSGTVMRFPTAASGTATGLRQSFSLCSNSGKASMRSPPYSIFWNTPRSGANGISKPPISAVCGNGPRRRESAGESMRKTARNYVPSVSRNIHGNRGWTAFCSAMRFSARKRNRGARKSFHWTPRRAAMRKFWAHSFSLPRRFSLCGNGSAENGRLPGGANCSTASSTNFFSMTMISIWNLPQSAVHSTDSQTMQISWICRKHFRRN